MKKSESNPKVLQFPSPEHRAQGQKNKQVATEELDANDYRHLQRVVWAICGLNQHTASWKPAVWYALRQATGCPVPKRFEVRHLPLIAAELRRILEISHAVRDHCWPTEKEAIRRIVKNREPIAPFVEQMKADEAAWLKELMPLRAELDKHSEREINALETREPKPAGSSCHGDYAEEAEERAVATGTGKREKPATLSSGEDDRVSLIALQLMVIVGQLRGRELDYIREGIRQAEEKEMKGQ